MQVSQQKTLMGIMMIYKNKEDLINNLSLKECPVLESKDKWTVRSLPVPPFAVLDDVPNYIVVNSETDKIEFRSDSISLCDHFIAFASSEDFPLAAFGNDEQSNPSIN